MKTRNTSISDIKLMTNTAKPTTQGKGKDKVNNDNRVNDKRERERES